MIFKRFVEPGRLCLVEYGAYTGKLVVITDIINENRVVVDGHWNGVKRQQIPVRWISLTDHRCEVPRGCRVKTLKKAMEASDILSKWNASSWAKKLAIKEYRKNMTDLDRFKLMLAKKLAIKEYRKNMTDLD